MEGGTGGREKRRNKKKRLESKEIQRAHLLETYQHFGLYREVWWRLSNILGYIVKSGGDIPTLWVI
jgi:hypothetical protein